MFFNSLDFALFLPVVFVVYWLLKNTSLKWQNAWIVAASYFFYGWWDVRFLLLIGISTFSDFFIARAMLHTTRLSSRKALLMGSLVVNIGLLGFFKYFNFFVENFRSAFSLFGVQMEWGLLNVILPVGISFYTFQTLSYTIDVYRKRMKPTNDWIAFAAFVSFFPQLVAGPIERASNLLPQFETPRQFNYERAVDGMRLILWGLFKKMVVADSAAELVNPIFNSCEYQNGGVLILGAVLFAFQIYGDFSGYSDIAIGTARLFGINLMRNFHMPYFARDIAEFWRHWHISLTTWFRDYLYIPMGGSRINMATTVRNTFLIFLISGLWHGANWTFIAWGAFHALLFLPLLLLKLNRKNLEQVNKKIGFPGVKELVQMLGTFTLVTLGWVFFRADTVSDALLFLSRIAQFNKHYFDLSSLFAQASALSNFTVVVAFFSILVLVATEWVQSHKSHALDLKGVRFRWVIYFMLSLFIYIAKGGDSAFIYFQF
jgi:alginate O-acetyltransferase complex protein AlgI